MARRYKISYVAMACASTASAAVALIGLVSCVGDDTATPAPPTLVDGSLADGTTHTDGSSANGEGGTGGGGDGASTSDANGDGSSGGDGSTGNDGGTGDGAVACAPGSVAGFVVPPFVHSVAQILQPGCSTKDTTALAQSCAFGASTYESCSAFPTEALFWGYQNCLPCLLTPEVTLADDAGADDAGADADAAPVPTYGATVVSRVTVPNIAGCIELTDPTDAGAGCAVAVQAAWRCEEYACNPTCPVTDDPSQVAYLACTTAAAATVCKSYADPAAACLADYADAGGATFSHCMNPTPFPTEALDGSAAVLFNVAEFFCNS